MEQEYLKRNTFEELSKSDFDIVEDEPNIIGWKLVNESGADIGTVDELLFDTQTMAVRYLVVDLTDNGMHLDGKRVLIPIELADLLEPSSEVVIPSIHIDQFDALPPYVNNDISAETEAEIREVIGSPAALRIEETITEIDQRQFLRQHYGSKLRGTGS